MEHSFFLTNAISTEMTIFGSNDRNIDLMIVA